jgi:hypothetical protein
MFLLEIAFQDDPNRPELLLIRRPVLVVGSSKDVNVSIDEFAKAGFELSVVRDLGRTFRVKARPIASSGQNAPAIPDYVTGTFDGQHVIDIDGVSIRIVSLDVDLMMREGESPERESIRVFQRACRLPSPVMPAVTIPGEDRLTISFAADLPILLGSAGQCPVRVIRDDIEGVHAQIGCEDGEFWVEDQGTKAGTFLKGQPVSGRVFFEEGDPIGLGRALTLTCLASTEQSVQLPETTVASYPEYPALVSSSEIARPARLPLVPGGRVVIGRDPSCDLWLGAPHISRQHCEVMLGTDGSITVSDTSTNGTAHSGGILRKGDALRLLGTPTVLNFGADITVGICFSEAEHSRFSLMGGDPFAFGKPGASDSLVSGAVADTLGGENKGRPMPSLAGLFGDDDPESHRRATIAFTLEELGLLTGRQSGSQQDSVSKNGALIGLPVGVGNSQSAALPLPNLGGGAGSGIVVFDIPGPMRILFGVLLMILIVATVAFVQLINTVFH